MTKPTPWTYETHELSEGFSSIVYDASGYRIADHLDEETARLIATAPDYDAAAELAIDGASPLNADECDFGPVVIERAAFDALRAARAKAKGES